MKPEEVSVFPVGEKNPFGQYFVGQSYLNMLTTSGVPVGNVTFEPGCRNNWHIPSHASRRRADSALHGRPWLLSGMGPACA